MKVVFFLADLYGGGAEKVSLTIINQLAFKNDVTLILVRENGAFFKDINSQVSVIVLNSGSVYKSFFALYSELKIIQPDILISSLDSANLLATFVSKCLKIKNITIIHGIVSFKYKNNRLMKFLIKGLCYSTLNIAVSKGVKEDLKKFSITSKVIFNPTIIKTHSSKKEKLVLAVGRLETVKNYKILIDAFNLAQLKEYHLIILGDGSLRNELQYYIDKNKIINIELLGFVNPHEFYKKATLLVSSSKSESFGNVVVEALSYGVNIVATKTVGSEEILEYGKYGTLVPIDNIELLAKAIEKKILNPLEETFLKARAREFEVNKIMNNYEKTIEELVNVDFN